MNDGIFKWNSGVIISIFTFENEKKVAVLNNVIQRVRGDSTFRQIFENVVEKHEKIVSYDRLKVYVSTDALKKEDVEVDCEETGKLNVNCTINIAHIDSLLYSHRQGFQHKIAIFYR